MGLLVDSLPADADRQLDSVRGPNRGRTGSGPLGDDEAVPAFAKLDRVGGAEAWLAAWAGRAVNPSAAFVNPNRVVRVETAGGSPASS